MWACCSQVDSRARLLLSSKVRICGIENYLADLFLFFCLLVAGVRTK